MPCLNLCEPKAGPASHFQIAPDQLRALCWTFRIAGILQKMLQPSEGCVAMQGTGRGNAGMTRPLVRRIALETQQSSLLTC
jgi:hypothetical protein